MLVAFVILQLVALEGGAQYVEDEDSYVHTYQEDDDVTRPLEKQMNEHHRHQRAPSTPAPRALSNEEISRVKDALKQLLPNLDLDEAITTVQEWQDTTTSWYTVKHILAGILKEINTERATAADNTPTPTKCSACTHQTLSLFGVQSTDNRCTKIDNDDAADDDDDDEDEEDFIINGFVESKNDDSETAQNMPSDGVATAKQKRFATDKIQGKNEEEVYFQDTITSWPQNEQIFDLSQLNESHNNNDSKQFEKLSVDLARRVFMDNEENTTNIVARKKMPYSFNQLKKIFDDPVVIMGRQGTTSKRRKKHSKGRRKTTKSRRRRTKWMLMTSRPTQPRIDVDKLVELITNLTKDYSDVLTNKVREELHRAGLPACNDTGASVGEQETTQSPPALVSGDPYSNLTGTIMGKCFVCGLTDKQMPFDASCADAFAGDFLPLVQVDQSARKQLANYRKYCRWMNIPRYLINETDPRSMWGRWTGGCSVRWIDISGIYTQRSCRNRHRAVMGKHWVSKRMAKLEMALQRQDNGCIISPMASLVPLSRGISLYARFHACVCTGSWCNRSPPSAQCTPYIVICTTFLVMVVRTFLLEFDVRWDLPRRKTMMFTYY